MLKADSRQATHFSGKIAVVQVDLGKTIFGSGRHHDLPTGWPHRHP
jgi:hypothetical protein